MSRLALFRRFVVHGLAAAVLISGCTSDQEAAPSPAPTAAPPSPPATGTLLPIVSPTPPATAEVRRTGDATLDAIIAAVETRDVTTLAGLVEYQEVGCTHADGLGGPPKCEPGQAEGEESPGVPLLRM